MRNITDILFFRGDISPFLVHLTRDHEEMEAKEVLKEILDKRKLVAGRDSISDVRFGGNLEDEQKYIYFSAICFTETPLSEAHCLLEIKGRNVDLKPYGLVFSKDKLKNKGVSPVIYINNWLGDQDGVVRALFSLIETHPEDAKFLIPLVTVFGEKLYTNGAVDFTWEREWRLPSSRGDLQIENDDVFVGLCPHDEIEEFEKKYENFFGEGKPLRFIDPRRNIKWYATKLIECRQRLDMKYSVV
jgi:hypothetical protein